MGFQIPFLANSIHLQVYFCSRRRRGPSSPCKLSRPSVFPTGAYTWLLICTHQQQSTAVDCDKGHLGIHAKGTLGRPTRNPPPTFALVLETIFFCLSGPISSPTIDGARAETHQHSGGATRGGHSSNCIQQPRLSSLGKFPLLY